MTQPQPTPDTTLDMRNGVYHAGMLIARHTASPVTVGGIGGARCACALCDMARELITFAKFISRIPCMCPANPALTADYPHEPGCVPFAMRAVLVEIGAVR